jgi:hypothetical protein
VHNDRSGGIRIIVFMSVTVINGSILSIGSGGIGSLSQVAQVTTMIRTFAATGQSGKNITCSSLFGVALNMMICNCV